MGTNVRHVMLQAAEQLLMYESGKTQQKKVMKMLAPPPETRLGVAAPTQLSLRVIRTAKKHENKYIPFPQRTL